MKHLARKIRSNALHHNGASILHAMHSHGLKIVPSQAKRNLIRSLIELKRNNSIYDFGPTQLKALDMLIQASRKSKTKEDILAIHRITCMLGLEKH